MSCVVACMWAQQSAEKALKALVVAQGIDPPKTHNLVHLERLAPSSISDQLAGLDLVSLARWAIEGRYRMTWTRPRQTTPRPCWPLRPLSFVSLRRRPANCCADLTASSRPQSFR